MVLAVTLVVLVWITVLAGRAGATESVPSLTLFPKTFALSLQRSPSIRSRRAFGFEKAMEDTWANAVPVQFVYARPCFLCTALRRGALMWHAEDFVLSVRVLPRMG